LCFIEGLYKFDFITKEVYEFHKEKYNVPLVSQKPKVLTTKELEKQQKIKDLEQQFSNVIQQWPKMKEKAKQYYIEKAKELRDTVPNAKLILALANGNNKQVEGEAKP
jgi:uridine kinase